MYLMTIKKSQLQIFLTILLSILIMTCLSLYGFAYETQPINAVPFISEYRPSMYVFGGSLPVTELQVQTDYKVTGSFSTSTSNISYGFRTGSEYAFEYPFNFDAYEYYVAFTVWSTDAATGVVGFVPSNMYVYTQNDGAQVGTRCTNFTFMHHDSGNMQGFTAVGQIPETFKSSTIRFIGVGGVSAGLTGEINFRAFIYQVNKSAGCSHADVIRAINSQTVTINENHNALVTMLQEGFNTLDNTMQNGNSDTQSLIDESKESQDNFIDKMNDLDSKFDSVIASEDDFKNSFDTYNQQVKSVMHSEGSFTTDMVNASEWVRSRMTDVYNWSGDFKIVYMFPLIFGLAMSLF